MVWLMLAHVIVSVIVIIFVIVQKGEGGASLMSGGAERTMMGKSYSYSNPLSKITLYAVIAFFISSILFSAIVISKNYSDSSIVDSIAEGQDVPKKD